MRNILLNEVFLSQKKKRREKENFCKTKKK